MTKSKQSKQIDSLLDFFEGTHMTKPQATAYNYLVSYTEGLIYSTYEGEALIALCVEVLQEAYDASPEKM